jgi:hypothetical protein
MKVDFLAKNIHESYKKIFTISCLCNEHLQGYTTKQIFQNQNERHCSTTKARVVDPV